MFIYLSILTALNVAISLVHVARRVPEIKLQVNGVAPPYDDSEYTYIGNDFPPRHPFLEFKAASLNLQETSHYGFNATESIDEAEWETFNEYPGGYGRAHLGPDRRSFLMTFYHQSHCLREIQRALVKRDHSAGTEHHFNHCIQYLRQTFLCGAADSVEKGDFTKADYATNRLQDEMTCWDWEAVFSQLDESWNSFTEWRAKWN